MKYYPPAFQKPDFHCPHCSVYAKQTWGDIHYSLFQQGYRTELKVSKCSHCQDESYWFRGNMIIPSTGVIEMPRDELPEDCKVDYMEARDIFQKSSRGSAALLRLCIQKLMKHLGESGENINSDIKNLVQKGLSPLIQQSLDICRVVGNNAVHPGEMNISDSPELTAKIFGLINMIVDDRIIRPKEIQKLFESLPSGALEAIEKRDKPK